MNDIFVYLDNILKCKKQMFKYIHNKKLFNYIDKNKVNKFIRNLNVNYITIFDEEYYLIIKNLKNPPLIIYYQGDISLLHKKFTLFITEENQSSFNNKVEKIIGPQYKRIIKFNNCSNIGYYNSYKDFDEKNHQLKIAFEQSNNNFVEKKCELLHLIEKIVIIELNLKSSQNIIVDYAIDNGIDVYVNPTRIIEYKKLRNNKLIGEGAYLLDIKGV